MHKFNSDSTFIVIIAVIALELGCTPQSCADGVHRAEPLDTTR